MSTGLAEQRWVEVLEQVASTHPTPGAGPSLAWTCATAAALVEMVTAITLRKEPEAPDVTRDRHDRARELRQQALALADDDAAAYGRVLAAQRRRDEPGGAEAFREALADAADPVVEIAETASEVSRLAADALGEARGGIRGEAMAAIALSAAVMRACLPLVELNLGGHPADPRRRRAAAAAAEADALLQHALPLPGSDTPQARSGS